MVANNILLNYPVYQLAGGDQQTQRNCMQDLTAQLKKRELSCVVFYKPHELDIYTILQAVRQNDLVFITGLVSFPVKQIHLGLFEVPLDQASFYYDPEKLPGSDFIDDLLKDVTLCLSNTPVWACVLIGGKSKRMGQPKHLLRDEEGRTWLERIVDTITPLVSGIVLSGRGELPPSLQETVRLPDIPGVVGPLNGILSAGRWQPQVSWILLACDMPEVSKEGVDWLLRERIPGCWGRVPQTPETGYFEPLFAWYDFRALILFEKQLVEGDFRIGNIASHAKTENPVIPEQLRYNWENVNSPEQLLSLKNDE